MDVLPHDGIYFGAKNISPDQPLKILTVLNQTTIPTHFHPFRNPSHSPFPPLYVHLTNQQT